MKRIRKEGLGRSQIPKQSYILMNVDTSQLVLSLVTDLDVLSTLECKKAPNIY